MGITEPVHENSTWSEEFKRSESFARNTKWKLTNIFTDQQTGKNFNRPRYLVLTQDVLRDGDVLIITELDRLGRNKADTMRQIQMLRDRGVRLMVLELPTTLFDMADMDNRLAAMMLDTINNLMIELYASMQKRRLRRSKNAKKKELNNMKIRGEWDKYGRPRKVTEAEFDAVYRQVLDKTIRPVEAMRKLGISKATYYRYVSEYRSRNILIP